MHFQFSSGKTSSFGILLILWAQWTRRTIYRRSPTKFCITVSAVFLSLVHALIDLGWSQEPHRKDLQHSDLWLRDEIAELAAVTNCPTSFPTPHLLSLELLHRKVLGLLQLFLHLLQSIRSQHCLLQTLFRSHTIVMHLLTSLFVFRLGQPINSDSTRYISAYYIQFFWSAQRLSA
jgi:hypothetical protein